MCLFRLLNRWFTVWDGKIFISSKKKTFWGRKKSRRSPHYLAFKSTSWTFINQFSKYNCRHKKIKRFSNYQNGTKKKSFFSLTFYDAVCPATFPVFRFLFCGLGKRDVESWKFDFSPGSPKLERWSRAINTFCHWGVKNYSNN